MADRCITRGTDASLALGCDKLGFTPSEIEEAISEAKAERDKELSRVKE